MTKQILLSLLNCSWQWGLLGGLTWLITRRFRSTNSTTHLLWLMYLLSLPILFALNQIVPAVSIGSTSPELTQVQPVEITVLAAQTTDLPEISLTESNTQSQGAAITESKFSFNWTTTNLILCIWVIGTLAMLIRFALGLYRIHRLRRTATVADGAYQAVCQRLAQKLNINRPVTVCFSDRVVSPISFGWLSPHILIPRKIDLEQFELVAAHELAHVQRLDWLTNLFSHVVGAVFFFHPIYYFLNRKLVHLRERICDDWVIQLTGARKNYAQCLLDLVRHENRAIPLVLSLNQPSQLESRIDSILKHNRRLDLKPKPRLLMLATLLLLTCLPLISMAQLMPLRTVHLSLFAQTPQESEKVIEKDEKKRGEQKKLAEMKDKKEYKADKSIKILDPASFNNSQENRLYSGPQPGEKLPLLKVSGISGELERQTYDITAKADGKPLVLFLQDTNAVGIKGLVNVLELLHRIDAFQKRHSKATGAEKSNQGIQIGVVFLADNLDTLPEWANDMLRKEIPNEVLTGLSPDGREGPGSYGLNRNVAQTVIIAEDGKVLHNFAFTQPMLYTNPHLLGAIAQAIEAEPAALEKWLNEATTKRSDEKKVKAAIIKENDDTSGDTYEWVELRNIVTAELDTKGKVIRLTKYVEVPPGKATTFIIKENDDTFRDTPDWIEFRNPTDTELNLKGWTLDIVTTELDTEKGLILFTNDFKIPADSSVLLVPYPESLKKLGITLEEDEQSFKAKKERGQTMEKDDARDRERTPSREELVKQFDRDGDGKLNREEGLAARRALANRENQTRYRNARVEVKNPTEFKKTQKKDLFSGPQPGEKLPELKVKSINGEMKDKTYDVIANADGQTLVLFLQDESGLGLRGLLGFSRLFAQIAEKSKQPMLMNAVFLGDTPDSLENQASKLIPHIPSGVLLGISQDGREGPGSYGLNRNVAQTVIIAKDGKVLYNFAFTQPMLRPDPHVLGAVGEAIGVQPATLERMLNTKSPVIEIKNPTEGEKTGKMLLNGTFILDRNVVHLDGTVVQFDELLTFLRNLPEELKSTLIIRTERDVSPKQITEVSKIAQEAGIKEIVFAVGPKVGGTLRVP